MPDPRSGIAETPFDNIDLGSQLLQAVASAHENTLREHRLKLDEKELGIREKQMQMSAAASVLPYLAAGGPKAGAVEIAGGLAPGSVSPDQLFTPAKEQIDQSFVDRMKSDPAFAKSYQDVGAFGPEMGQLDEGNRRMAAEIATKLRTSPGERAAYGLEMMKMFGDKAATLFNRYASDTGVTAPVGVPTIGQREAGAAETSARAHAGAAQADLERVRIDLANTLGPGFTTKDPNLDPALKQKYVGEWIDFMARKRAAISPEALDAVIPIGAIGRGIRAAAEPSPEFKAQLAIVKEMGSRLKDKDATTADQQAYRDALIRLHELAPGYAPPKLSSGAQAPPRLAKERLADAVNSIVSLVPGTAEYNVAQHEGGSDASVALKHAGPRLNAILGKEKSEPLPDTLGAFATPEMKRLDERVLINGTQVKLAPADLAEKRRAGANITVESTGMLDTARRIMFAFRQAGADPQEVQGLESEFAHYLKEGSQEEISAYLDRLLTALEGQRELQKSKETKR